jgi:hypothetical protein
MSILDPGTLQLCITLCRAQKCVKVLHVQTGMLHALPAACVHV